MLPGTPLACSWILLKAQFTIPRADKKDYRCKLRRDRAHRSIMPVSSPHTEIPEVGEATKKTKMKKMLIVAVTCAALVGGAVAVYAMGMRCGHCKGTGFQGNVNCFACKGTGRNADY